MAVILTMRNQGPLLDTFDPGGFCFRKPPTTVSTSPSTFLVTIKGLQIVEVGALTLIGPRLRQGVNCSYPSPPSLISR
jgi:hypothetical protein